MIPFTNLLKYLPNIAEVPRDVIISQTSKDTDYKFSSVYSGERDAFLGLDVTVSNESGSTSYFFGGELTSRLRSRPLTELVIDPIEIISTPVFAYAFMFLEFIPPDASNFTPLRNFFF